MRWRKLFESMKVRVTVPAVLALAASMVATTVVLVSQTERDILAERQRVEIGEALRTAAQLSLRVVEQQQMLSAAALQMTPEVMTHLPAQQQFLDGQTVLATLFQSLFLIQTDGAITWLRDDKSLRQPAVNVSDRPYFMQTLADLRPVVSQPLISRVSGEPVVILTAPLMDHGRVYGVLAGGVRLHSQDLLGPVVAQIDGYSGVQVVVSDADGLILAHPDRQRVGQNIANDPRMSEAYQRWLTMGKPVEPAGLDLRAPLQLVAAAGVPGPDWMIWRCRDAATVLEPLITARMRALQLAAALVALMGLGLIAWLWWLLRPLSQLEARAEKLFDPTVAPHEGWPNDVGEIGHLQQVLRRVAGERTRLEARNNHVLQQLGSVMSAAPVGLAFTRNQRFELVSSHLCTLLRRSQRDLLGEPSQIIFASNEDYQALGPAVAAAFAAGLAYRGEVAMLRADGGSFWGRLSGNPVDPADPTAGTIWTINDISDEVSAREALEWSANHDVLTGLANRQAFERRLSKAFDSRPRSLPSSLILFDLDHFKPINDQHGHAAGDAMLQAVARAASNEVRAADLLVRLGGDEFAVVLEHCPVEAGQRVAKALHQAIADIRLPWEGHVLTVGVSLGLAPLTPEHTETAQWVAAADQACYAAKAAGRGTVRVHGSAPIAASASPLRLIKG
jgi:diguanylate cyclase (GGDEF)-like protein